MNARTIGIGAGTAVTTFLVAGALTIELLGAGEAPGIGIVGVFVGFVMGLVAGGVAGAYADRLSGSAAAALIGYAVFGVAFLTIAGMSYVNVLGADDVFTFPVHVAVSLMAAIVVALLVARGADSVHGF